MHSLCCGQVFCVDCADEREYLHRVPVKLQLTSRQFFELGVQMRRRVYWTCRQLHSLCRGHVQGHDRERRMRQLRGRHVLGSRCFALLHELRRRQVLGCHSPDELSCLHRLRRRLEVEGWSHDLHSL